MSSDIDYSRENAQWIEEMRVARLKWRYQKWYKWIDFEATTQYWVFIPTVTWHREIREFEVMFLCFNLIFCYRKLFDAFPS